MPDRDLTIPNNLRPPTVKRVKRCTLIGRKFHWLTPYGLAGYHRTSLMPYWLCRCDCGNWRIVSVGKLRNGLAKSCGCYINSIRSANNRTHGMSKTRTYRIWSGIISRCHNPNNNSYADWGGRGIQVCDRWRQSFENFFSDMGHPPSDEHQIDRVDVNGNYQPGNCRWITQLEQMRNTRRNRYLTINGETHCVSEWAEITGINQLLIGRRLRRGWTPEEALEFKERPITCYKQLPSRINSPCP